jgi:hypothetical protein
MSFSVVFVQCQETLQLPHMNMPLFMPDLRELGCEVEGFCVHVTQLDRLAGILEGRKVDLLGIEHMAPYGIARRVKAVSPRTKIVVGGNGFLDVFTKTDVDFAVSGAGREAIRALVTALQGRASISNVPNLFFKDRRGGRTVIDCTTSVSGLSLARELRPYAPEVDWTYAGFCRKTPPLRQRGAPTVVADLGCAYRSGVVPATGAPVELGSTRYPLTDAARERLSTSFELRQSGGCSFCTYGGYVAAPVDATVELLLEQMAYLQSRYGFDRFSIGSEEPFRFLMPLLHRAVERGITLRQIRLRCRVDWLLGFQNVLREAVAFAREHRFQIAVWQVGFESFSEKHLALYSKGQTVEGNLEAARLLDELETEHTGWFANPMGSHGFLGNTAWTTPGDVAEQIERIDRLPRSWRRAILGEPVKLFDELLPYARAAERDGLLVRRKNGRDTYRFRDDRTLLLERGREYVCRKLDRLGDAFFWRAALDAYWEILRVLVERLRSEGELIADFESELSSLQRTIDRAVDPILKAHRLFQKGARQEARGNGRAAREAYRAAQKLMPENGIVRAGLSRVAHALGDGRWAAHHGRLAVCQLEKEGALYPGDPNIDLLLAQCLARLGERERSGVHLRTGFAKRRALVVDGR